MSVYDWPIPSFYCVATIPVKIVERFSEEDTYCNRKRACHVWSACDMPLKLGISGFSGGLSSHLSLAFGGGFSSLLLSFGSGLSSRFEKHMDTGYPKASKS